MARVRKTQEKSSNQKPIEQYSHPDKERLNNPPVGLVSDVTDVDYGQKKKKYEYDPHLDPQLQWAGKKEHTSFDVPIVSLHVHERIDPRTIISSVQKGESQPKQMSLFQQHEKPLREAVEFYKHRENWTNRLIAGDSLLVMNSLIEKEAMAGKVQMIYFDPPYGIKYGSNFQPFVNKKDVRDGSDDDLTTEPEMIKAFRDTWEIGIHSFLSYIRDRLKLGYELLNESGIIYLQISDENIHLLRCILDEVFGKDNFVSQITFQKIYYRGSNSIDNVADYLLVYAKNKTKFEGTKFRSLFRELSNSELADKYNCIDEKGQLKTINLLEEFDRDQCFFHDNLLSPGASSEIIEFDFNGRRYKPDAAYHWKTSKNGLENLKKNNRLIQVGNWLKYKRYASDFPYGNYNNIWTDTVPSTFAEKKIYAVQTYSKVVERCLLICTDPGDLVLDITCGSGTTAYAAEKYGRRWITCDTSRVSIALTKQRLMVALYDYYELAREEAGVSGGFKYKIASHLTLKTIANNEPVKQEYLYDQPIIDKKRVRVTGPFTLESIPAPVVKDLEGIVTSELEAENSISRSGETLRQDQWRDELLRSGVRAKSGIIMNFTSIQAVEGTKHIQAKAETKSDRPEKVLIVFGPEHAPLEQRSVELAIDEARFLKPDILLFCAFQFDDEAAKDIDETPEKLVGFKLLKAQMNMDLQTDDLKKSRNNNQSFWLIGQPDVIVHEIEVGEDKGKVRIEVNGFDYYNPRTGAIESGSKKNIAMWLLDPDYDGRSLFPRQVFLPLSGSGEGWSKIAKNLKSEIDEEKIEALNGTISLPFSPGKIIAVKIIDDRGIESLKIIKR